MRAHPEGDVEDKGDRSFVAVALASDRVDVPPLPPHNPWKRAKALMSSLMKGDPDRGAGARRSFKGKMREVFPERRGSGARRR